MCKSKNEGGQRCYPHTREQLAKANQQWELLQKQVADLEADLDAVEDKHSRQADLIDDRLTVVKQKEWAANLERSKALVALASTKTGRKEIEDQRLAAEETDPTRAARLAKLIKQGDELASRNKARAAQYARQKREADENCPGCGQFSGDGHECPITFNQNVTPDVPTEALPDEDSPAVYRLSVDKMAAVQHRIDKANRRLERNGIAERFEVVDKEEYEQEIRSNTGTVTARRKMVTFKINYPAIKAGDHTFVARLDALADGTMIPISAPGEEVGEFDSSKGHLCEHCNVNRPRNKTYLLRDGEGNFTQVGSSCIKDYLGIKPEGLWALEFDPIADEEEDTEGEGGYGDGGGWRKVYAPKDLLRAALAVSNNGAGFVTSREAQYGDRSSTASHVSFFLQPVFRPGQEDAKAEHDRLVELSNSPEVIEKAEKILEWASTLQGNTDYAPNVRALARQEAIELKHMGMFVSVIAGYEREKAEQAKEKANPVLNEWMGQVKDKLPETPVTVLRYQSFEGQYGTTTLVTMRDDEGHDIKWWATGAHTFEENERRLMTNALIKALDTWKGTKQTTVTRAKLKPLP